MDILVMLEDNPEHSTMLAHVNSVPAPLNSERPPRNQFLVFPDGSDVATRLAADGHDARELPRSGWDHVRYRRRLSSRTFPSE